MATVQNFEAMSNIQGVLKFHGQAFRACGWVQGTLRKISPRCLRRLIAEIQADETPLLL
jgi:hypothetical protein